MIDHDSLDPNLNSPKQVGPNLLHVCRSRSMGDVPLLACAMAHGQILHAGQTNACLMIDDSRGVVRARSLGLILDGHTAPPLRRLDLGVRGVRAWVRDANMMGRVVMGRTFDAIVCWGTELEPTVRRACPDLPRVIVDLDRGVIDHVPGSFASRATRSTPNSRAIRTVRTPTTIQLVERRDIDARAQRAQLVGEEKIAIALIGTNRHECDAPAFVHVLGMLLSSGLPVVGVVDRGITARLATALRRLREGLPSLRMCIRDEPVATWVSSCDAAVFAPGERFTGSSQERSAAAHLLVRAVADAGVPIVGSIDLVPSPNHIRTADSLPSTLARALRQRLVTEPISTKPMNRTSDQLANAWRSAILSVLESDSALVGTTGS